MSSMKISKAVIPMADLKSILGTRTNVAALIYEDYLGMRICVGGFYYLGNERFIDIDGISYKLTDMFSEFHWIANSLTLIK